MREAMTATVFLGLRGRLFFVVLIACLPGVRLSNAPRMELGETGTFVEDAFSFSSFLSCCCAL